MPTCASPWPLYWETSFAVTVVKERKSQSDHEDVKPQTIKDFRGEQVPEEYQTWEGFVLLFREVALLKKYSMNLQFGLVRISLFPSEFR